LVSAKPKQTWPRNQRIDKGLLPAPGKERMEIIYKVMPSSNKGSMGILFCGAFYIT
jgi:hypothetical protein